MRWIDIKIQNYKIFLSFEMISLKIVVLNFISSDLVWNLNFVENVDLLLSNLSCKKN